MRRGELQATIRQTLEQAGRELIARMKAGTFRKRDGAFYTPSVIRGYEAVLERRVYDQLGSYRLAEFPQVVGVILMVVGIVVFLTSLVLWRTWWGAGFWGAWGPGYDDPAARGVVRRRVYRPAVRRTTYVEEEPPPPPGPPAP